MTKKERFEQLAERILTTAENTTKVVKDSERPPKCWTSGSGSSRLTTVRTTGRGC